jgi:CheY-like chemotaxis protein
MEYKPLILVAEDNEANRDLIREILEEEGFRVTEAINGKDAIEKAAAEIPDLILMDIEMPVMSGLEAIKNLMQNEETNRVPIIVLTGLAEMDDRIKAFYSGAMDYVNKPFNTHELIAHVKSYLRFSLLNKKYVLSTIKMETKLPNRAAFREKLAEVQSPRLFLIKIDDIDTISRFYGESTGTDIEIFLAGFLHEHCPEELKENSTLFHLDRGLFGFLLEDPDNRIDNENAKAISFNLLKEFQEHQVIIKDVHHHIELTTVICFTKEKILEKSEMGLDEALRNKTPIMVVDDIIEDVYRTIGDNIFWLKKIKEAVTNEWSPSTNPSSTAPLARSKPTKPWSAWSKKTGKSSHRESFSSSPKTVSTTMKSPALL